ncbi:MAG: hypothetical protein ACJAXH_000961 [Colwellia sp.]|jgi:hypothetical protein
MDNDAADIHWVLATFSHLKYNLHSEIIGLNLVLLLVTPGFK